MHGFHGKNTSAVQSDMCYSGYVSVTASTSKKARRVPRALREVFAEEVRTKISPGENRSGSKSPSYSSRTTVSGFPAKSSSHY